VTPLAGPVVADFDGTLARLTVPWPALRDQLGVTRIDDLWREGWPGRWDVVTAAEVRAARAAAPIDAVSRALGSATDIAILTSNDEAAVDAFLEGQPSLRAKVRMIVGRRTLAGPKTDFETFAAGYARCVAALMPADGDLVYIGDADYELAFAQRLGARAVDVRLIDAASADDL
jgi:phosphoglycolate phosphatase-like HAD superfamily hydrolase